MGDVDPFAPKPEAEAFRVWLFMADFPEECTVKTVLKADADAAVSFADDWLHNYQPRPTIGKRLFDSWRVQIYIGPSRFEDIATGKANRECRTKAQTDRSFRGRREAYAGATEGRNGVWALDRAFAESVGKRKGRQKRVGNRPKARPAGKWGTLQARIEALKEEARKAVENGEVRRDVPIHMVYRPFRPQMDFANYATRTATENQAMEDENTATDAEKWW